LKLELVCFVNDHFLEVGEGTEEGHNIHPDLLS